VAVVVDVVITGEHHSIHTVVNHQLPQVGNPPLHFFVGKRSGDPFSVVDFLEALHCHGTSSSLSSCCALGFVVVLCTWPGRRAATRGIIRRVPLSESPPG